MCGAEADSLSMSTLLGRLRPIRDGIFILSTKRDNCLESKSYDTLHKNDNLYLWTLIKIKGIFKNRQL